MLYDLEFTRARAYLEGTGFYAKFIENCGSPDFLNIIKEVLARLVAVQVQVTPVHRIANSEVLFRRVGKFKSLEMS